MNNAESGDDRVSYPRGRPRLPNAVSRTLIVSILSFCGLLHDECRRSISSKAEWNALGLERSWTCTFGLPIPVNSDPEDTKDEAVV